MITWAMGDREMFIDIVQKEMPGNFIRSYTGSRYIFGA